MADRNRDGYDDETGLPVEGADRDGDGRDDNTGGELPWAYYGTGYSEEDRERGSQASRDRGDYSGRRAGGGWRGSAGGGGGGDGSSGGGGSGGGYHASDGSGSGTPLEEFDSWAQHIPLFGDASADRVADANAAAREARNRSYIDELELTAPSADELYTDESLIAAPEETRLAWLDMMDDGYTTADRAAQQASEREMGRAMRSQRDADIAALRARGMGDSGTSISAMFSAQQGGANMMADREAGILQRGEQRRMHATDQLADWNRWDTGRAQDHERRRAQSRVDSRQQAYENRERSTAMHTGQYQGDQSRARDEEEDDQDRKAGYLSALGELIDL